MRFPVRFIAGFMLFVFSVHITSFAPLNDSTANALGSRVLISELMYDPAGSDTNHEWIEIWNNGPVAVDLTGWKLFEASTNHALSAFQGSLTMPSDGFAVLTGSGAVFRSDHPSFSGTILDTSFSLSNTGELLSLKNSSGSVIDTVNYTNTPGAAGNGKTLELDDSGQFVESLSAGGTPGFRISGALPLNNNDNASSQNLNLNGVNQNSNNTNAFQNNENSNTNVNPLPANENINSQNQNLNAFPSANLNTNSAPDNTNLNARVENENHNALSNQNFNSPGNLNDNSRPVDTNQNANISPANLNDNTNNDTDDPAPVTGSGTLLAGALTVNEIFPHPATGGKEWIELFNSSDHVIDLSQVTVSDNLGSPKKLSGSLFAGQYRVLEPSPLSLNNDGDTVLLKTASGAILDSMQYGDFHTTGQNAPVPGIDQSLGRYPNLHDTDNDRNDFRVFGQPTKGTANVVDNHSPVAIITVQYPYKTSGNAPLSLNLTAEDSYDPDGDVLTYSWDYGDGFTSTDDNPLSHKYLFSGTYTVILTLTDTWGARSSYYLPVLVTSTTEIGAGVANGNRNRNDNTNRNEAAICSSKDLSGKMVISEILPNPDGTDTNNEFIEILNNDDHPINLCGWSLDDEDGGSKSFLIREERVLDPGQYMIFNSRETRISLNNDEDMARLFDPDLTLIDHLSYKKAPQGKSLSRSRKEKASRQVKRLAALDLSVGLDSKAPQEETVFAWTRPSPGQPNIAAAVFEFQGIIINELIPNPDGSDGDHEFIELKNVSDQPVPLTGWVLSDASGAKYTFPAEAVIEPGAILLVPRTSSKISLNNDSDSIILTDADANLQDQIEYDTVQSGKSFSRFVHDPSYPQDSSWEWANPTPGDENQRLKLEIHPDPAGGEFGKEIKVKLIANKAPVKIFYAFSGDATPDDYQEYKDPIVLKHSTELWYFALTDEYDRSPLQKQLYIIRPPELNATGSGAGLALTASGAVIISEVYPNPEGKDEGQEWIELYNTTPDRMDLSHFYFQSGKNKHFVIPPETLVDAGSYVVIPLVSDTFTLLNTKDLLELRDPSGFPVDVVSYTETSSQKSLVRIKDSLILTLSDFPTPGRPNIEQTITSPKLDADRDLLPDEIEYMLKTNPGRFDTDKDLLPDSFEKQTGSDPLTKDATPEKKSAYREYLAQFVNLQADGLQTGLYLKGKSFPNSRIQLIFWPAGNPKKTLRLSDPVTSLGNFSVKVPFALLAGEYELQAVITDPLGTKSIESRMLSFSLAENYTPPRPATTKKTAAKSTSSATVRSADSPAADSSGGTIPLLPAASGTPPADTALAPADPDLLEPDTINANSLSTNDNRNTNANNSDSSQLSDQHDLLRADVTGASSGSFPFYLVAGGIVVVVLMAGLIFLFRKKA